MGPCLRHSCDSLLAKSHPHIDLRPCLYGRSAARCDPVLYYCCVVFPSIWIFGLFSLFELVLHLEELCLQTRRSSVKSCIPARLNIEENGVLEGSPALGASGVGTTTAKDDQVALIVASGMSRAPQPVGLVDILVEHLPLEVHRIERTDIVEDIGSCAAIHDELVADSDYTHLDTAAGLLTYLSDLLPYQDTLHGDSGLCIIN